MTKLSARRIPQQLEAEVQRNQYPPTEAPDVSDIIRSFQGKPLIQRDTRLAALGSCFAQEISRYLREHDYHALPEPWGVVYSPASLFQIADFAFGTAKWEDAPLWRIQDRYYLPYLKASNHSGPMYLAEDTDGARARIVALRDEIRDVLLQANVIVLTLGQTEVWRDRRTGLAPYAIPFDEVYDPDIYEFHNLSYQEILERLDRTVAIFKEALPGVEIVISVSPIPLAHTHRPSLGAYVAARFSKSVLHAAAYEITYVQGRAHYMPSYEIAMSKPESHFKPDGRHVRYNAVAKIMEAFRQLYMHGD